MSLVGSPTNAKGTGGSGSKFALECGGRCEQGHSTVRERTWKFELVNVRNRISTIGCEGLCSQQRKARFARESKESHASIHTHMRGIYESVGRDRMYGRVHARKEAQACAASSSMRTVCEPFKILKILKLSF